jgi:peptidoglycan/xylan/chitin deacetylase (PgdA/CDA1 family)
MVLVSASEACAIVEGSLDIPRAVWVTFDDGDPSVVDLALPLLEGLGIFASMYVCPGVIASDQPFWWQVVEEATKYGLEFPTVSSLKTLTDERRREHLKLLQEGMPPDTRSRNRRQLDESSLRRWLDAGNSIGNHTWDHPLLDMASEDEQIRQIRLAHDWLTDLLGSPPESFAYPNGNVTFRSRLELMSLGYRVGLLFDHRIASVPASDPLTVSRLRVNAWQDMARYRSIVSGIHPWAHHLLARE